MNSTEPLHILMIFTGGTISSRTDQRAIALDQPPYRLLEDYVDQNFVFDVHEPFSILSENMTPQRLHSLFIYIQKESLRRKYDGIIITHGTDTLAFTAQMAYLLLAEKAEAGTPTVLLGSKFPLDNPRNDGQKNFKNALELIAQVRLGNYPSGVYVVGEDDSGQSCLHSAGLVIQADEECDDVRSFKGQVLQVIPPSPQPWVFPRGNSSLPRFPKKLLEKLQNQPLKEISSVLILPAYVGLDYRNINFQNSNFQFVLQRLYHSGTTCTPPPEENASFYSLSFLQEQCHQYNKKLFLVPMDSKRLPYESTAALLESGITPLYDLPMEAAWARLLLADWLNLPWQELFL